MTTTQFLPTLADLEERLAELHRQRAADEAAATAGSAGTLGVKDRIEREVERVTERRRLEQQVRAIQYFEIDGWEQYTAWLELSEQAMELAVYDGHPSARYAKILRDAGLPAVGREFSPKP